MILCELCTFREPDGHCSRGHKTPLKMRCIDFSPELKQFCATQTDQVKLEQIKQMALYFGLAGKELKRVMAMGKAASKLRMVRL